MNFDIEKQFVRAFIEKNRRDRIGFELQNKKKRKEAIGRFCHSSLQFLDESKIIFVGKTNNKQEIKEVVKKYLKEEWYLISWDDAFDGKKYNFEKCLDIMLSIGMASIMICEEYAIIKEEQEVGASNMLILHNECFRK